MDSTQLYINSAAIGARTLTITGKAGDAVSATGYAAWIASITGSNPIIIDNGDGTVKITLSQDQVITMRHWLDQQVKSAVSVRPTGSPLPSVQIELGPVLTPWALQYAIPFMVGTFTLGWIAHWLLSGRKR